MKAGATNESLNNLLQGLRGIDLPPAPSAWPPAPGWVVLILLLTLLLGWLFHTWYRRTALRRAALRELARLRRSANDQGDHQALVRGLSQLLRRLSLARYPRWQVAGLHGEAWLRHLDGAGGGRGFSRGPGRILLTQPYRPEPPEDTKALLELVEHWIRRNT